MVLRFHLDVTQSTTAFWWIDSPHVPVLYAAASSLTEARRWAMDKQPDAAGVDVTEMRYELVDSPDNGSTE